ncbi:MAG: hypothetical protein LBF77_09880 [Spirochaetaceae bacterium]|jgi:hypothetical protein|nr:hypothetical protein [Spirochaetaceae bacterium]
MIKEAKDLLEEVVKERVPESVIVRSALDESQEVFTRKFPLVSLITNPGGFDDREAKTVKYFDEADGMWKKRYIRGSRVLPILLRLWAKDEEDADRYFSRIIPAIPRTWEYDNLSGLVLINHEEHSDHTGNVAKRYLSVAEIQFTMAAALEEELVPTFTNIENDPGDFDRDEED